ncbi:unnamed protein product [Owenia fusiformis]|uniref:Uncharacterized protein n=1 Tax=Owenia fusiformis TaxID=6347 RepID=A0A8J1URV9_OWEFU|nr:unnamed protein product [Owenia fusiformis]
MLQKCSFLISRRIISSPLLSRCVHYIQGQSPSPKIREYFYYIDHQGQLFLDDAKIKNFTSCFKEKDFLEFFFKRVKTNESGRYEDFPYISLCGRERNFIRCDDQPIVYTHLIQTESGHMLTYGYAGDRLKVEFEPSELCMLPWTGRVYHPASDRTGGVGLIKSSLAIELSQYFEYGHGDESQPPTHFNWQNHNYTLTNNLVKLVEEKSHVENET